MTRGLSHSYRGHGSIRGSQISFQPPCPHRFDQLLEVRRPVLGTDERCILRVDDHEILDPEGGDEVVVFGEDDAVLRVDCGGRALDNVSIASEGTYDPVAERLDMLTTLTFDGNAQYQSLAINPELMDIPIPMRCTGDLNDPRCRLDEQQSKQMVTTMLRSSANSEARAELEKKIDKEVPEEYRERARGFLDKLGRMLDK